jgi:hypothetical protein
MLYFSFIQVLNLWDNRTFEKSRFSDIIYYEEASSRYCRRQSKRGKAWKTGKNIPKDFEKIIKEWEQKRLPFSEVLKLCNMSEATFYRRLREYRLIHGGK